MPAWLAPPCTVNGGLAEQNHKPAGRINRAAGHAVDNEIFRDFFRKLAARWFIPTEDIGAGVRGKRGCAWRSSIRQPPGQEAVQLYQLMHADCLALRVGSAWIAISLPVKGFVCVTCLSL